MTTARYIACRLVAGFIEGAHWGLSFATISALILLQWGYGDGLVAGPRDAQLSIALAFVVMISLTMIRRWAESAALRWESGGVDS